MAKGEDLPAPKWRPTQQATKGKEQKAQREVNDGSKATLQASCRATVMANIHASASQYQEPPFVMLGKGCERNPKS